MSTISFSPVIPILENRPPGFVICGVPGSGKSYFMLNLAANALMTGCRLFCLDAKNDMMALRNIYPDIAITDINRVEPGALNPFAVLPNVDTNTLMSIISIICGNLDDRKTVSITPIVNDFVIKNRKTSAMQSMESLANYLYASSNEDAQAVGTMIKINEDSQYGPLLLKETKHALNMGNESRVISLLGLPMPQGNSKADMTSEERFSSAIIFIICKMLNNILKADSSVPTVLLVDESHILFKSDAMFSIVEDFLVLGRSLNVATGLASQNITHFPESIAQLISNKFTFRMSRQEAEKFVELFDNSSEGDQVERNGVVSTITRLKTGSCYFIDRLGRSNFIHVTSNLGDITSNPLLKKRG